MRTKRGVWTPDRLLLMAVGDPGADGPSGTGGAGVGGGGGGGEAIAGTSAMARATTRVGDRTLGVAQPRA